MPGSRGAMVQDRSESCCEHNYLVQWGRKTERTPLPSNVPLAADTPVLYSWTRMKVMVQLRNSRHCVHTCLAELDWFGQELSLNARNSESDVFRLDPLALRMLRSEHALALTTNTCSVCLLYTTLALTQKHQWHHKRKWR